MCEARHNKECEANGSARLLTLLKLAELVQKREHESEKERKRTGSAKRNERNLLACTRIGSRRTPGFINTFMMLHNGNKREGVRLDLLVTQKYATGEGAR